MKTAIWSLVLAAVLGGVLVKLAATAPEAAERSRVRRELFAEIQPVKVTNCEFARAGDGGDGGYVYCKNLIGGASSVYSYGIAGTDAWGCQMSAEVKAPVHEYDCFDDRRPVCAGAVFHSECVGAKRETIDGRLFDSIASQIERNGDAGKHVIMKLDVEGAEWQSFLATPDELLQRVDQMIVEFHIQDRDQFVEAMKKLKQTFWIANVHYNNWVCQPGYEPLPGWAFEALLVNKSLATVDPSAPVEANPFDAPNTTTRPDCHVRSTGSKSRR